MGADSRWQIRGDNWVSPLLPLLAAAIYSTHSVDTIPNFGFNVVDDISFVKGKQISHQSMVTLERDDGDVNLTIFKFRGF